MSSGVFVQWGLCEGDPTYGEEWVIHLLMEYFLVEHCYYPHNPITREVNRTLPWCTLREEHAFLTGTGTRIVLQINGCLFKVQLEFSVQRML